MAYAGTMNDLNTIDDSQQPTVAQQLAQMKAEKRRKAGDSLASQAADKTGSLAKVGGNTARAAGLGMQATGKAMNLAGKGAGAAGNAMMRGGAALSETGIGAIAGVPLAAMGGLTRGLGAGMQGAGKTIDKAGSGVRQAGKTVHDTGDKMKNTASILRMQKAAAAKLMKIPAIKTVGKMGGGRVLVNLLWATTGTIIGFIPGLMGLNIIMFGNNKKIKLNGFDKAGVVALDLGVFFVSFGILAIIAWIADSIAYKILPSGILDWYIK